MLSMLRNRFFSRKDEIINHPNLVTVIIYGPSKSLISSQISWKNFGHVTLRTRPEPGKGIYVSFYPEKKEKCCHETCRSYQFEPEEKICPTFNDPTYDSEEGHFHTYKLDGLIHTGRSSVVKQKRGDQTFRFIDLDVDAIEKTFEELLRNNPRWAANLLKTGDDNPAFVCSSIIYHLLSKGGLAKYIQETEREQINSAIRRNLNSTQPHIVSILSSLMALKTMSTSLKRMADAVFTGWFPQNMRDEFLREGVRKIVITNAGDVLPKTEITKLSFLKLPFLYYEYDLLLDECHELESIQFKAIDSCINFLRENIGLIGAYGIILSVPAILLYSVYNAPDIVSIKMVSPEHVKLVLETAEENMFNEHHSEHVSSPTM